MRLQLVPSLWVSPLVRHLIRGRSCLVSCRIFIHYLGLTLILTFRCCQGNFLAHRKPVYARFVVTPELTSVHQTIIFVVSLTIIGLLLPYDEPRLIGGSGSSASPFVIVLSHANISGLDGRYRTFPI